jgi:CubicO group peptidase (beta-lactamase class C family)
MSTMDKLELRALVGEILNRRPAVGLAVGVVRDGHLDFFHGHGFADVDTKTPIDEDTVFRVASITKTFTAIAVMQLWEQGLVDLDAPANDYLRTYHLPSAEPTFQPATVRQLLTHTAGIPELLRPSDLVRPLFGEIVEVGRPVPPLVRYYRGGIRVVAEPGTRFVYTDHGFATLGQIVEDVSGQPLDRYLREHVFEPLGMAHTDLIRSDRVRLRLATGYTLGANGTKAVADYETITTGASAAFSTTADMARYVAALLGGGTNEYGSVLKPATLDTMFEPHYQPDPRVPGIGLAFWRGTAGGHRVVEHGGILPGFDSEIFLAPDDGVGVLAFTNGASRVMLWLPGETAGLLSHLLDVPPETIRTDLPQHPEIWGEICGWYSVPSRWSDLRLREMAGVGVEVLVRGGQLMLRVLTPIPAAYRGFPLHPDDERDPYAFRIDLSRFGIDTARVVFAPEPATGRTAIHLDLMPLSAWKQPPATNPRRWAAGALGGLAATTVAMAAHRRRGNRH